MSNLVRSALLVLAVLTSATATMARPHESSPNLDPNSADNVRTFWDNQQRSGS